ncbi:type II toxin-antitoxin system RelE/ParE family toxin [Solidesulfovibrio sp.]
MIVDFACRDTQALAQRGKPIGWLPPNLQRIAQRKLRQLNAVERLQDMGIPPGNCLEKLSGDRKGQFSIRINDQYRICFTWKDGNAFQVELVDYHG